MVWTRAAVAFWFGMLIACALAAQTFNCDGNLILATNQGTTRTFSIQFGLGFVGYNQLSFYIDEGFDAMGYNPKDNYIYGVQASTNSIVRLRRDGTYDVLGTPPSGTLRSFAGDCSPDGRFLCHDNDLNQILVFDVINNLALVEQVNLFWNPDSGNSGPFLTRIEDFALDPNNPTVAYAFQGNYLDAELVPPATRGYLLEINLDYASPDLGMVTPVFPISEDVVVQLGSLFFTEGGGLFGYGSQTPGPVLAQNRLVSINRFAQTATIQGTGGPEVPISDGCSCPYSLSFDMDVNPRVATCSDDEVTYTITIDNRSYENLSSITFSDTIPEGMIIESVDDSFNGIVAPDTGPGTRFVTINGLQIPPRGGARLEYTARINDVPVGNIPSQSHLRNLPILFGGRRVSDDPFNPNTGDSTVFATDSKLLDTVALDITPPTDCLLNNDGRVVISSPDFLPNISYNVGLIDGNFVRTDTTVMANGSGAFQITDLPAGDYELERVQPLNTACAFEWKDTTIMIAPPNEQLLVTVGGNAPICEGDDLLLDVILSPGGTAAWRGPDLFVANGLQVTRAAARTEYSGLYELTANYGACEQLLELDILVAPEIQAFIGGQQRYCEREDLRLKGKGNGDQLTYEWSGPNGLASTEQFIDILSMTSGDEGIYQVIVDNGICRDTTRRYIDVLPSPTIDLPKALQVDFCDPVLLEPTINGDADVEYAWSPEEGLSCSGCPTPQVLFPVLPEYQLRVENSTACTDSTTLRVILPREDILYAPTAFSPNFDNTNDFFQVFPSCVITQINQLDVYHRWGSLVFTVERPDPLDETTFWNGYIQGDPAPTGTYLWEVEFELVDGTTQKMQGAVNLVR